MIIHYLWDGYHNGLKKYIVKYYKNKSNIYLYKKIMNNQY
jgi:hypothetical protein